MAKTTRKTEASAGAAKPAPRRRTTAAPAAGAEKVTTRRRTKIQSEAAAIPATADSRPVKGERPAEAAPVQEPTHDEIALRAWSIYQRRGSAHGNAAHDWFQAKTELFRERGLKL